MCQAMCHVPTETQCSDVKMPGSIIKYTASNKGPDGVQCGTMGKHLHHHNQVCVNVGFCNNSDEGKRSKEIMKLLKEEPK